MIKRIIRMLAIGLFALFVFSCNRKDEIRQVQRVQNPIAYDTPKSIQDIEVHFYPAAGEEQFKSGCITCHSLRYIEMQPDFPRKTWEKIVDKMVHTFGAPITDSSAKIIAGYLVSVKGKK